MSVAITVCIRKLCVRGAANVCSMLSKDSAEHVKVVLEDLSSSSEETSKFWVSEMLTLRIALGEAQAALESLYADALEGSHTNGFFEGVEAAFTNLSEIFESCFPQSIDLANLNQDPQKIAAWIADEAAARGIDEFRAGEGRKLLIALVVFAYTSFEENLVLKKTLQRVTWTDVLNPQVIVRDDLPPLGTCSGTGAERINKVMSLIEQGGKLQLAETIGISEMAVVKIVGRLLGEGVDVRDLLRWIDRWFYLVREEMGTRLNEDEAFQAAWREAERRLRAGQDNAAGPLIDELVHEKQLEAGGDIEKRCRHIRLLESAIRYDELEFNADAAVAKLRELAKVEGYLSSNRISFFLELKADEFQERGDQKDNASALLIAIRSYQTALAEQRTEQAQLHRGTVQNKLGNALATLGEQESGRLRLEQAVKVYELALKTWGREEEPLEWAKTQNNLGVAFQILGRRENGTIRLEQAVVAYRLALEERTREQQPLDWATTQNNLGGALAMLGTRDGRTLRLEQAVEAYRLALEELTRERQPLQWATAQNELGGALVSLGGWDYGTLRLEQAVEAYKLALAGYKQEGLRFQWAGAQHNLGSALLALGERESGTGRLEQAVEAYRLALEGFMQEQTSLDWAVTQSNLGSALMALGERESGTLQLEQAVKAFEASLTITALEWPEDWVSRLRATRDATLAEIKRRAML